MADTLTDKVRRKLDITWDDEVTTSRISDIMENASITIRHKIGLPSTYDFETVGQEQNFFLAYCLYAWNHAEDEFDVNYQNDLLQLRQKWAIEFLKNESGADDA